MTTTFTAGEVGSIVTRRYRTVADKGIGRAPPGHKSVIQGSYIKHQDTALQPWMTNSIHNATTTWDAYVYSTCGLIVDKWRIMMPSSKHSSFMRGEQASSEMRIRAACDTRFFQWSMACWVVIAFQSDGLDGRTPVNTA